MAERSLQLVMTRVFEAPRELVFRAWIDPELEKRWSSPLGVTVPVCETDPRPGGAWRLCMRTPVGEELWAAGVYRQVRAPERLVTTHAWENPDGTPGHQTVITDGTRATINRTGNPGMATGGSGDVLTGVITGLIGQGMAPYDAACLGVHVHGLAGDLAAKELSETALMATDLVDWLPKAFKKVGR